MKKRLLGIASIVLALVLGLTVFSCKKTAGGDRELDKTALNNEITDAKALAEEVSGGTVKTSEDGKNVLPTEKWVTPKIAEDLTKAIKAAEDTSKNADATEAEVTKAKTDLDNAVKAYKDGKKDGTKVDKTALNALIAEANNAKKDIVTADTNDPSTVESGKHFVTKDEMKALDKAIENAEAAKSKTQEDITKAEKDLKTAIETFKAAAKKTGTKPVPVDRTALKEAIDKAKKIKTDGELKWVSYNEGKDFYTNEEWVTYDILENVENAIPNAENVYNDNAADQTAINEAKDKLNQVLQAFKGAKQFGTKPRIFGVAIDKNKLPFVTYVGKYESYPKTSEMPDAPKTINDGEDIQFIVDPSRTVKRVYVQYMSGRFLPDPNEETLHEDSNHIYTLKVNSDKMVYVDLVPQYKLTVEEWSKDYVKFDNYTAGTEKDETFEVKFTIDTKGKTLANVKVNGKTVTAAGGIYTVTLDGDKKVEVNFENEARLSSDRAKYIEFTLPVDYVVNKPVAINTEIKFKVVNLPSKATLKKVTVTDKSGQNSKDLDPNPDGSYTLLLDTDKKVKLEFERT